MSAEPPLQLPVFEATVNSGIITVVLRGEFDLTSEDFLAANLEQVRLRRPHRLIFEAAHVSFIDCASVRLIARTRRWLPAGARPVISSPSPSMRRAVELTGFGALCEPTLFACRDGEAPGDRRLRQ